MKPILLAALPLLGACAVSQVGGVMHPTLSGSLSVRHADGVVTPWSPDRCVSGDLAYFAGFDFLSSQDGGQLRAAVQPIDGPVVRWSGAASSAPRIVRATDCSVLDVAVHPTDWHVNDVRDFAGHVEMHCLLADGLRIDGRIDVDHCH